MWWNLGVNKFHFQLLCVCVCVWKNPYQVNHFIVPFGSGFTRVVEDSFVTFCKNVFCLFVC